MGSGGGWGWGWGVGWGWGGGVGVGGVWGGGRKAGGFNGILGGSFETCRRRRANLPDKSPRKGNAPLGFERQPFIIWRGLALCPFSAVNIALWLPLLDKSHLGVVVVFLFPPIDLGLTMGGTFQPFFPGILFFRKVTGLAVQFDPTRNATNASQD